MNRDYKLISPIPQMGTLWLGFGPMLWGSLEFMLKGKNWGFFASAYKSQSDALISDNQPGEQRLQSAIHLYCVGFVYKDKKKY